jgi:predicted metalloprotease with PDZ domain
MSRMAPFIDGGRTVDRTNWSETVISYYTFGGAIAAALDLTLRDRTDGRVTLDDYMRAMWRAYGKPGGGREGHVDRPYAIADAEQTLAEVSGDPAFARDFFAKYIQGHDVADYPRLLGRAGFVVRRQNPGVSWAGDLRLESRDGARVATLVSPEWPVYAAGLEQDDVVEKLDGQRVNSLNEFNAVLWRHKPGDRVKLAYVDRTSRSKEVTVTLAEDPAIEVVPVETVSGGTLTAAQRAFRERWLGKQP